ncbi:MAG: family 16 glycoside hydrolase [Rhodothermales bacterium]
MKPTRSRLARIAVASLMLLPGALAAQPQEVIFTPVKIDGPVHDPLNNTYWYGPFSETASVLDIDNDGDYDIAAGRNWYEAPLWIKHSDFRPGAEINGPETESNSEFAMDVNKDGWTDIVSSGWMFMKGAYWYENPGPNAEPGKKWESHKIHQAYNMEGVIHGDIDGDGDEDVLVNHWALIPGQGMTWIENIDEAPWFVEHVVGTDADTHGNGLGDVNMDGRMDIITGQGWYEQPADVRSKNWPFHADWNFEAALANKATATAHPNLVYDVNGDGLNDVIIGSAHSYGLAWYEQRVDASGKRSFEHHWIETQHSVFHTMALGDLTGDGKDDLVAGKRLFAHYGGDVGVSDPSFVFWYDMKDGAPERHILSYNHVPYYPDEGGAGPPPNNVVGVGMKINIKDMDHDGKNDVVLAGKTGLYIFYNKGNPPTPNFANDLAPYYTYPTWREWPEYTTLFNGKDFTGWKVPKGDGGHWKVVDFAIDYDAMSKAKEKDLWTEEEYCDYSLHVDWRFKEASGMFDMPTILPDGSYKTDETGQIITEPMPNSDSGIYLRGPDHQVNLWNWPVGSGEIWTVRNNDQATPEERAAAVPKMRADNPIGEWNSMDINMIGDRVSVMLNGHWVIENARITEGVDAGTSMDKNGNMVITRTPIAALPACGPIGLQHHGGMDPKTKQMISTSSLVQFRNLWIRPLEKGQALLDVTDPADDPNGWETLFNGRDLTGWITGENNKFVVENGELTVKRDNPDGQEHNLDYLWTENTYGDFILDLEFKVVDGTNSGVFFRTADILDPVWTGLEIQVANSYGQNTLSRTGTAGALYDLKAPVKNAINAPGEWNTYRLRTTGSRVRVELNGERVLDVDLAQWREANRNPDGTPNKFATPGAAFARVGYIGLQDHGKPVWYRNIRVKRLDGPSSASMHE